MHKAGQIWQWQFTTRVLANSEVFISTPIALRTITWSYERWSLLRRVGHDQLSNMIEDLLDHTLLTFFNTTQNSIKSVVHNYLEHFFQYGMQRFQRRNGRRLCSKFSFRFLGFMELLGVWKSLQTTGSVIAKTVTLYGVKQMSPWKKISTLRLLRQGNR